MTETARVDNAGWIGPRRETSAAARARPTPYWSGWGWPLPASPAAAASLVAARRALEPGREARVRAPGSLAGIPGLLVASVACEGGEGEARWAEGPLRGQTVEVAGLWAGPDQAKLSALVRFEQETGVAVRYTSTGRDITATLMAGIAEGAPPDVAILPSPGILAYLARRGALMPLRARVEDNYAPASGSASGRP